MVWFGGVLVGLGGRADRRKGLAAVLERAQPVNMSVPDTLQEVGEQRTPGVDLMPDLFV